MAISKETSARRAAAHKKELSGLSVRAYNSARFYLDQSGFRQADTDGRKAIIREALADALPSGKKFHGVGQVTLEEWREWSKRESTEDGEES